MTAKMIQLEVRLLAATEKYGSKQVTPHSYPSLSRYAHLTPPARSALVVLQGAEVDLFDTPHVSVTHP